MAKDNYKKIGAFLKGLDPVEFRYLELTVQLASSIQSLIRSYNLTKEEFCEMFSINPKKYDDYIKGNFNYSLHDMATLNYAYRKLETDRVSQEEVIKVTAEKND